MATFSQVAKGGPQRLPVRAFPLIDGTMLTGDDAAVIPLLGDSEAKVLKGAREFAIEHGVMEPKVDDPLYKLGRAIWTCALGVVDADPKIADDKPVLFFDGGVKQIRERLDRDRILLLARQQEAWQSEISPSTKNITRDEMAQMIYRIKETPEGVELPLECWPPAMQRIFITSVVNTLLTLQAWLLESGSGTPAAGANTKSSATSSGSLDPATPAPAPSTTPASPEGAAPSPPEAP